MRFTKNCGTDLKRIRKRALKREKVKQLDLVDLNCMEIDEELVVEEDSS